MIWFHAFSIYDIRVTVFNLRGKATAFLWGCWCMWRSKRISPPHLFVAYLSLSFLSHIQWPALCTVLLSNLTVNARIMLATIMAPPSPKGSSSEAKCKRLLHLFHITCIKNGDDQLKWLECDCPFVFFWVNTMWWYNEIIIIIISYVTNLTLLLWIVKISITVFLCYIRFSFSDSLPESCLSKGL